MQDFELLERERELQVLNTLIEAACRGTGQLVVVEGVAGIGKTSLLAAARAVAGRAGMRVLGARGSELEQGFAFGVIRQLFEPVLARVNQAERDELLAGAASQAAVLFDQLDTAGAAASGGDVSFATLHGLFWLASNLCAHEPLMLVMDDLHWSDPPTLRFLTYLLPRLEGLPLLLLTGLRPAETVANQHLLSQITTDPLATMVYPAPLSPTASAQLVRRVLAADAEDAFCVACHTATSGNPLLLHKLVDMAAAEDLEPTAAGATRLYEIGPRVVGQRIALQFARLGPVATLLCGAVSILGDRVNPAHAAALAGLEATEAMQAVRRLTDIGILYRHPPSADELSRLSETLGFVHPLVRAAVYEELSETVRLDGHARAAHLLAESGRAAEQVAAHLLLVPPADNNFVVTFLRRAADEAFARGSPDSALAYLERCVQEPPPEDERADILLQLGIAAQMVDIAKGADYLAAAMAAAKDPQRKAVIAELRGLCLLMAGRGSGNAAVGVLSEAIQILSDHGYVDLYRRLLAILLNAGFVDPNLRQLVVKHASKLRNITPDPGLGSRMIDVALAWHDMLTMGPARGAINRARRGLNDGILIDQAHPFSVYGCSVLIAADLSEVTSLLDAWIAAAHQRGSLLSLAPAKCFRGLVWLSHGALAEAVADFRDSIWAITTSAQGIGWPISAAYLAEALMEQGNLDEAEMLLTSASMPQQLPRAGYWAWFLASRARLLIQRGRMQEALKTILDCGRQFAAHGGQNPAVVAWRSDAALALFALDRRAEACALAAEELTLARKWGAPTALGRALRITGLVQGGQDGLAHLRDAVNVLAPSPARLGYAKALVELGAALRRSGQRIESRQHLNHGIELAQVCGAIPLAKRGWTELRATGARPRAITLTGPDTLTPSERRVAELAAAGHSNRDIAQTLFITTNTVEVHLTRTYRKLGITGRIGLTQDRLSRRSES